VLIRFRSISFASCANSTLGYAFPSSLAVSTGDGCSTRPAGGVFLEVQRTGTGSTRERLPAWKFRRAGLLLGYRGAWQAFVLQKRRVVSRRGGGRRGEANCSSKTRPRCPPTQSGPTRANSPSFINHYLP
jgi:hypothetical protein